MSLKNRHFHFVLHFFNFKFFFLHNFFQCTAHHGRCRRLRGVTLVRIVYYSSLLIASPANGTRTEENYREIDVATIFTDHNSQLPGGKQTQLELQTAKSKHFCKIRKFQWLRTYSVCGIRKPEKQTRSSNWKLKKPAVSAQPTRLWSHHRVSCPSALSQSECVCSYFDSTARPAR